MIDLYTNGTTHQTTAMRAMAEGVRQDARLVDVNRPYSSGEVCVVWGTRHLDILKKLYKRVVVIERGYFNDRLRHYSLGIGGLNGRADFRNIDCPSDRWEKHGVPLKPWAQTGDYYLVMGQVDGDMSINGVDIGKWYHCVIDELQAKTDKPVYFRAHPAARPNNYGLKSHRGDLSEVLQHCAGVATYNSNSGVDAAMAGVPVMVQDIGSMAWGIAAKSVDELINFHCPDRLQWAYNLAYTQWTLEEITNGTAWGHLCHKIDHRNETATM